MRFILSVIAATALAAAQTAPSNTAVAAPGSVAKKSFLDKPTLEAYVRHLFVWSPQIKVAISDPIPGSVDGLLEVTITGSLNGASQSANFYLSKNGESVVQGTAFNVNQNPFKPTLDKLKTAFAPGYGAEKAPVVVVVFSDFQCPYCREEAKMIRSNVTQTFSKEVKVYFKDFPLDQIHAWARPAAIAGRCIYREDQSKFWLFHDWAFENQEKITPETFRGQLEGFLAQQKIAAGPVLQCVDAKATDLDVTKSFAEGRALDVNSTPTLFVNGRKLAGNVSWPQLKQIIEFEIEYQKTAKNAGEDCGCELTLPSVLPK